VSVVKPARLYEQLLQSTGRTVAFRDFIALVEAFGFEHVRTTGSHRQYVHPRIPRPFPIQPEGKDAKRYQVRELLDLVERYGLHI
jgi:predicted RNA binding protein YcfA (HicA-like mRNA interferase family)